MQQSEQDVTSKHMLLAELEERIALLEKERQRGGIGFLPPYKTARRIIAGSWRNVLPSKRGIQLCKFIRY
jgi:hypothetical protein